MNDIDRLQLLADLVEEHCELNHGPGTRGEDYPATDYIVLPFGYQQDEMLDVCVREVVIPVCHECVRALLGNEWTLLYCFECNESRWVYRGLAKNRYRHHILWLKGCPDCADTFGGLYFNDTPAVVGEVEFLMQMAKLSAA